MKNDVIALGWVKNTANAMSQPEEYDPENASDGYAPVVAKKNAKNAKNAQPLIQKIKVDPELLTEIRKTYTETTLTDGRQVVRISGHFPPQAAEFLRFALFGRHFIQTRTWTFDARIVPSVKAFLIDGAMVPIPEMLRLEFQSDRDRKSAATNNRPKFHQGQHREMPQRPTHTVTSIQPEGQVTANHSELDHLRATLMAQAAIINDLQLRLTRLEMNSRR